MSELSPQFERGNFEMELLSRLDDVNDEHIESFRNSLQPIFAKNFDRLSEEKKMIISSLADLPFNKLRSLVDIVTTSDGKKLDSMGIHDLKGALQLVAIYKEGRKDTDILNQAA